AKPGGPVKNRPQKGPLPAETLHFDGKPLAAKLDQPLVGVVGIHLRIIQVSLCEFLGDGMNPQQVAQLIEDGLGGSHAMVTSEDNVHFEAVVIAPAVSGKRPIQRHQMVYSTL